MICCLRFYVASFVLIENSTIGSNLHSEFINSTLEELLICSSAVENSRLEHTIRCSVYLLIHFSFCEQALVECDRAEQSTSMYLPKLW